VRLADRGYISEADWSLERSPCYLLVSRIVPVRDKLTRRCREAFHQSFTLIFPLSTLCKVKDSDELQLGGRAGTHACCTYSEIDAMAGQIGLSYKGASEAPKAPPSVPIEAIDILIKSSRR
jgi:hypothetical protein